MNFTLEQMQRMGIVDEPVVQKKERGWKRHEFKEAFKEQGFTFAEFERQLNLPVSSVSLSLTKRYPKIDKLISAFLDVPLHILWPNQYLRNGNPIHHHYKAEFLSDEELEKLNAATDAPREQIVISLPNGMNLT